MRRVWSGIIAFILIGLLATVLVLKYKYNLEYNAITVQKTVVEKTFINYKDDVIKASDKYDLSPSYLLALIVLNRLVAKLFLSDMKTTCS